MAGKRACWSESGPWVGLWEWSGLGVWFGEVSGVCVGDVEVSDFNHRHSSLQDTTKLQYTVSKRVYMT